MIPRVEDAFVAELERRIVAAVPETAPGDGATPETFVTTVEGRTVVPCVQEDPDGLTVFCTVRAEISVIFYSQKRRNDYSALLADLCRHPWIDLGGAWAKVRIERSEAVEGPYLSNDAWLFVAEWPVFEAEPGHGWEEPRIGRTSAGAKDIHPQPRPDLTDEPEGGGRFGRGS